MMQLITGIFLMTAYSPSSSTAWGSVYFISYEMVGGWFVRGMHHFGAQAMVILLFLHLIQVLVAGAYRAPREVNWWLGMILLFITLGFSLTGYLLPAGPRACGQLAGSDQHRFPAGSNQP